jgi:hypothetical protein
MTDQSTSDTERYEVVIDGTDDGMEKDYAELLKRRLVNDGFHDHAVTVRSVETATDQERGEQ